MADIFHFIVRPEYHGDHLLIEFLEDHRRSGFPDVAGLLEQALRAKKIKHPTLDEARFAAAMDRYFGYWKCPLGCYEIDDDVWGLFISANENNRSVIAAVARALVDSGRFAKKDVDHAKYV